MRRPGQSWIAGCRLHARHSLGRSVGDQTASGLWTYLLTQFFANHAHWRRVATGQALNKFDAVSSVRTDSDRIVRLFVITWALNSQTRAQIFHHFQSTRHRTTQRAADPNVRFPGRMLAKHWVKRHHFENVDRLEAELFRDPEDGFVADEPEVFLPQMQKRHYRAAAVLTRIAHNRVVHSPLQFGWNLDARRGCHR